MANPRVSLPTSVAGQSIEGIDIGGGRLVPTSVDRDATGDWGYAAGVSGTLTLSGGKRVLAIGALADVTADATVSINGGPNIIIPAGSSMDLEPRAKVTDPSIVFTGTLTYCVEYVSG